MITDRYLDNDLFTDDLLFYRLEMETIDSRILSSAYHTPAFARSMDTQHFGKIIAQLEQSYPVTSSTRSEITDIHEFKSVLIYDFILNYIPSGISQMNSLQMYLLMEEINFDSFLNILSIKDFKACTFLFADNDPSALHDYIENAFNELEPLFRQQVLFAPAEWHDEKLDLIDILDSKLAAAVEIYSDDSAFLESLPPVLITNLVKDSSGLKISINRFNVHESSIELRMNEESIPVPFEYNDSQMISIPSHWEYVELIIAGDVVQTLPVVNEEGVLSIALDDQYIFSDEIFDLQTMRSIPEQDFQLNEIAFNVPLTHNGSSTAISFGSTFNSSSQLAINFIAQFFSSARLISSLFIFLIPVLLISGMVTFIPIIQFAKITSLAAASSPSRSSDSSASTYPFCLASLSASSNDIPPAIFVKM